MLYIPRPVYQTVSTPRKGELWRGIKNIIYLIIFMDWFVLLQIYFKILISKIGKRIILYKSIIMIYCTVIFCTYHPPPFRRYRFIPSEGQKHTTQPILSFKFIISSS